MRKASVAVYPFSGKDGQEFDEITRMAMAPMNGVCSQTALTLLPVIVGAVIGMLPTMALERWRSRAVLRTRWDADLAEACTQFAATARSILDMTEDFPHAAQRSIEPIRGEHGRLQNLMAQIRLLAQPEVQLAARQVVRHSWALQIAAITGVDPRASDFPADSPRARTLASLFDFYSSVRRQLKVPHAEDLIPLNPPVNAMRSSAWATAVRSRRGR